MKRILGALAVAAALAFAPSAMAQVSLDLKLAYSVPSGDAVTNSSLSDGYSGALPIEVAGRYRFTPNLSAGVYYQFAPAFIASNTCDAGVSCSGYDMRLGIEAVYGFMPEGGMNPWISVGTGWEWTQLSASAGGISESVTFSGWEYFNVQVGADFALSKMFALGPYVGYFGGTYTNVSSSGAASGFIDGSIPSEVRAFHGWFQFGVKGTLNL